MGSLYVTDDFGGMARWVLLRRFGRHTEVMNQNRRTRLNHLVPLLFASLTLLCVSCGFGGRSSDGPLQTPFGLSAACVGIDSPTPFLVAPGEVILEAGTRLSDYRVIISSPTGSDLPEILFADPDTVGAGTTKAIDGSVEFQPIPTEEDKLEGPSTWTLILRLSDTAGPQRFVLEGVEYTIDGTDYTVDDTFELTLMETC